MRRSSASAKFGYEKASMSILLYYAYRRKLSKKTANDKEISYTHVMKGRAMKDSLKKGLIIGAAGSAICVLWHHLLTKKMMQLAMDRVAPQDRSNGKMRVSGSPEMIETTEIVKRQLVSSKKAAVTWWKSLLTTEFH